MKKEDFNNNMHIFWWKVHVLKNRKRCEALDHNVERSSWLLVQYCFFRYLTTSSLIILWQYVTRCRFKCFVELFISMQNLVLNPRSCPLDGILLPHTRNNEWCIGLFLVSIGHYLQSLARQEMFFCILVMHSFLNCNLYF